MPCDSLTSKLLASARNQFVRGTGWIVGIGFAGIGFVVFTATARAAVKRGRGGKRQQVCDGKMGKPS